MGVGGHYTEVPKEFIDFSIASRNFLIIDLTLAP